MGTGRRVLKLGGLLAIVGLHAAAGWALAPAVRDARAGNDHAPVLEVALVEDPEPTPEPTPVAPPPPDPAPPDPVPPPEAAPDPPPDPPAPIPPPADPIPAPIPEPPTVAPPPEAAPAAPEAVTRPPTPPPPPPAPRPRPRPSRVKPATPAPTPAAPAPAAAPPPAPRAEEPTVHPAVIACRAPAYPAESRRLGETGTVGLSLLVDTDGSVRETRVDQSSGHQRLDEAAVEALTRCRFKPGERDGRVEATWAKLRYVWKLS